MPASVAVALAAKPAAEARGYTARRRWPPSSATSSAPPPRASQASLAGPLKVAASPSPSRWPAPLLPASVLTASDARSSARTRLLPESATKSAPPEGDSATPRGCQKKAPLPTPSKKSGCGAPASVLTTPPGVTARSLWFCVSATYTVPAAPSTATPSGALKAAPAPAPSAKAAAPLPASVLVAPAGLTSRMRLF